MQVRPRGEHRRQLIAANGRYNDAHAAVRQHVRQCSTCALQAGRYAGMCAEGWDLASKRLYAQREAEHLRQHNDTEQETLI